MNHDPARGFNSHCARTNGNTRPERRIYPPRSRITAGKDGGAQKTTPRQRRSSLNPKFPQDHQRAPRSRNHPRKARLMYRKIGVPSTPLAPIHTGSPLEQPSGGPGRSSDFGIRPSTHRKHRLSVDHRPDGILGCALDPQGFFGASRPAGDGDRRSAHAQGLCDQATDRLVCVAPFGWCGDSNLKPVAVRADDGITPGPGDRLDREQPGVSSSGFWEDLDHTPIVQATGVRIRQFSCLRGTAR